MKDNQIILTYKYRIKDNSCCNKLCKLAANVNFVWNYINDLSFNSIKQKFTFLSDFDINNYLSGSYKEVSLHSTTFQEISKTYVTSRNTFKKNKLSWRNYKRSLGWIPFKASAIKLNKNQDAVTYLGETFRFYKSRPVNGQIKSGSFNQDARGRWYLNLVVAVEKQKHPNNLEIGIDLGQKDKLTLSNGQKFNRENFTQKYEDKLARAQRAGKKKQVRNIHAKIKNSRTNWNHEVTTEIAKNYNFIVVGDINIECLIENTDIKAVRKSLLDCGLYQIKSFLEYKANKLGGSCYLINEAYSTQTCSNCKAICGPKGQTGLSIREWVCGSCGHKHDRDVNAAKNILRMGHHTLLI